MFGGRPMTEAPQDGTPVLVWAAPYQYLPGFFTIAAYHPDAGWCVDELREAIAWWPINLPEDPRIAELEREIRQLKYGPSNFGRELSEEIIDRQEDHIQELEQALAPFAADADFLDACCFEDDEEQLR